jgi:hypothetical protein
MWTHFAQNAVLLPVLLGHLGAENRRTVTRFSLRLWAGQKEFPCNVSPVRFGHCALGLEAVSEAQWCTHGELACAATAGCDATPGFGPARQVSCTRMPVDSVYSVVHPSRMQGGMTGKGCAPLPTHTHTLGSLSERRERVHHCWLLLIQHPWWFLKSPTQSRWRTPWSPW